MSLFLSQNVPFSFCALFDLNGASNNGLFWLPDESSEYCGIAPAVVDWLYELSSELGMYISDLQERFYEVTDNYKSFSFPLTTGQTWRRLEKTLNAYWEKEKIREQEDDDEE